MRVLVPLLSKKEDSEEFVEMVTAKAKEIILLIVIDTAAMSGQFGFAAGEIAQANALMQKMKNAIGKKRKTCEDIIEWGDTATKIEHMAMLRQVDKIYLVKQDNQFSKKLLRELEEKLPKVEIEAAKLEEEKK
jgi:hypothetical protein